MLALKLKTKMTTNKSIILEQKKFYIIGIIVKAVKAVKKQQFRPPMNAQSNPYGFLSVFDFHVAYIRPPFVIRPKIQS